MISYCIVSTTMYCRWQKKSFLVMIVLFDLWMVAVSGQYCSQHFSGLFLHTNVVHIIYKCTFLVCSTLMTFILCVGIICLCSISLGASEPTNTCIPPNVCRKIFISKQVHPRLDLVNVVVRPLLFTKSSLFAKLRLAEE